MPGLGTQRALALLTGTCRRCQRPAHGHDNTRSPLFRRFPCQRIPSACMWAGVWLLARTGQPSGQSEQGQSGTLTDGTGFAVYLAERSTFSGICLWARQGCASEAGFSRLSQGPKRDPTSVLDCASRLRRPPGAKLPALWRVRQVSQIQPMALCCENTGQPCARLVRSSAQLFLHLFLHHQSPEGPLWSPVVSCC